jgi:hypothetical protein
LKVSLEGKARFDVTYFMNDFDLIIGFGTAWLRNMMAVNQRDHEVEASYASRKFLSRAEPNLHKTD